MENPPKKVGFSIPSDQLAEFEQILTESKSVQTDFDWSNPVRTDYDQSKNAMQCTKLTVTKVNFMEVFPSIKSKAPLHQ